MAVLGLVDGANDAVDAAKRIDPAKLFRRQQVEIVTDEAAETLDVAELVHPLGRAGDAQRAAAMEAGRQAGLGGQDLAVEPHRMGAHLHDRGIVGEMRAQARRMPGRAGGQLLLLDQHAIAPAALGQVVEQRDAHRPAADDQNTRVLSHAGSLASRSRMRDPLGS